MDEPGVSRNAGLLAGVRDPHLGIMLRTKRVPHPSDAFALVARVGKHEPGVARREP